MGWDTSDGIKAFKDFWLTDATKSQRYIHIPGIYTLASNRTKIPPIANTIPNNTDIKIEAVEFLILRSHNVASRVS